VTVASPDFRLIRQRADELAMESIDLSEGLSIRQRDSPDSLNLVNRRFEDIRQARFTEFS
jgi:hypothetical protein